MRSEVEQTIYEWKKRFFIMQVLHGAGIALLLLAGFFTVQHLFAE